MKYILSSFFAIMMLLASTNIATAQSFGHLNSDDLLNQLPAWKAAEKDVETFALQKENQLQSMQQDYQTKVQKLQQDIQSGIITKVEEQTRTQELYALQQSLQEFSMKAQQELEEKRIGATQPIIESVQNSIDAVAAENGFTYIFDTRSGALLYFPPADDVTALVKAKLGM